MTLYPKFVGNSPSTDNTNLYPGDIFAAINFSRGKSESRETATVVFWDLFNEAVPVMEEEIKLFFQNYLNEINGLTFWEHCKKEFPFQQKNELNNHFSLND